MLELDPGQGVHLVLSLGCGLESAAWRGPVRAAEAWLWSDNHGNPSPRVAEHCSTAQCVALDACSRAMVRAAV